MAMYLCVDAGTTNLKAAIVDGDGALRAFSSRALCLQRPERGASEMDMEALWQALCGATMELAAMAPNEMQSVAGVGICAQGDGLWPLDGDGNPVRNAILWNDTRAGALGIGEDSALSVFLVSRRSTALFSGAFPVLLRYLKEEEPQSYARTAHVLHCKDWLNYKLTGVLASDYSDQSTAGIDIYNKTYVYELFDRLHIAEAKSMLPPLYQSGQRLGTVTSAAQAQTGIPAGVPVIAGCIDVAASSVGAGVRKVGDGCCILGTTLCSTLLIEQAQVDCADTNGSALCSVFPGKYNRVMAALSGTVALDWARAALGLQSGFDAIEEELRAVPAGCEGVLFHPYIQGERAPFREPCACGGFYGLRTEHTRAHMLRAAYEGLALSVQDCFKALPYMEGTLYVSGGGAKSDFLCQLIADTLYRQVCRPAEEELGIQGIFYVLLRALQEKLPDTTGTATVFYPDQKAHTALREQYAAYKNLQAMLAPYWRASR